MSNKKSERTIYPPYPPRCSYLVKRLSCFQTHASRATLHDSRIQGFDPLCQFGEFLLEIDLTLMRRPAEIHRRAVRPGNDLGPQPAMVDERRKRDADDDHRGAHPDDVHPGILRDLQAGELLWLIADQLEGILRPLNLEQIRIMIKNPGRRFQRLALPDGETD